MKIFLPIYSPPWQSRSISIDWSDCAWSPVIKSVRAQKLLPAFCLHRGRRHQLINPMKIPFSEVRRLRAFTLVELLTVIAIIAILAGMLLPVISRVRAAALKTKAKMEAQAIATAIEGYDSAYGRFPVSQAVQTLAGTNDFTYGGTVFSNAIVAATLPAAYSIYTINNSEVIAILMDFTNYPNGSGATVNMSHIKNPQQTKFLNATITSDPTLPGVGPDLAYRDPWGNPYIITMDLNYDENCNDAFYELNKVSQNPPLSSSQSGFNGLHNPDANGTTDNFQFHGKVMVWSAGPDGKIDGTSPNAAVNAGVNKDNVLSW